MGHIVCRRWIIGGRALEGLTRPHFWLDQEGQDLHVALSRTTGPSPGDLAIAVAVPSVSPLCHWKNRQMNAAKITDRIMFKLKGSIRKSFGFNTSVCHLFEDGH